MRWGASKLSMRTHVKFTHVKAEMKLFSRNLVLDIGTCKRSCLNDVKSSNLFFVLTWRFQIAAEVMFRLKIKFYMFLDVEQPLKGFFVYVQYSFHSWHDEWKETYLFVTLSTKLLWIVLLCWRIFCYLPQWIKFENLVLSVFSLQLHDFPLKIGQKSVLDILQIL